MEQESPDKLVGGNTHCLLLLVAVEPIVFIPEGDLMVVDMEQALVGEGHAVSIAAQVLEHLFRAAERRLGVDHPFTFGKRRKIVEEVLAIRQGLEIAKEL